MLRDRQLRGVQVLLFAFLLVLMVTVSTFAQAELTDVGEGGFLVKMGYGGVEKQGGIRFDLGLATKTNFSFGIYYDYFIGELDNGSAMGFDVEFLPYKTKIDEGIGMFGFGIRFVSVTQQYSTYWSTTHTDDDMILHAIGSMSFGSADRALFNIAFRPGLLVSSDSDQSPFWGGLELNVCLPSENKSVVLGGGFSGRDHLFEGHIGMGILFGTN